MKTELFVLHSRIEVPAAEVYARHARPEALELLLVPSGNVQIMEKSGGIERGGQAIAPARARKNANKAMETALP